MAIRTVSALMLSMLFIRFFILTSAIIHDYPMLPMLLDPENYDDYVWADFAYPGECHVVLLSLGGFESLIHEKGSRNYPLSATAKERNSARPSIRACDEHGFFSMTTSMGG